MILNESHPEIFVVERQENVFGIRFAINKLVSEEEEEISLFKHDLDPVSILCPP